MGKSPAFEKVGECLYRNPSSGSYYALLKVKGKQIKQSLETKNLHEARRKMKDFRIEQSKIVGKMTVDELCYRQLETIRGQAPKTVARKTLILNRVKEQWKGIEVTKVKQSEIKSWLASFNFGVPSYNLHLQGVRELFQQALSDKLLVVNPVLGIRQRKVARPVSETPTREQFRAVVQSIRSQNLADTREESADFVEFLGLAGLGLAEASALTWANVSLDKGQMVIFRHKTKQGFVIPIYPQLRPLMEKRFTQAKALNGGVPPLPMTKVFSVANAKKAIEAACKRLKLPEYTSRAFRRTFITEAIERGVDVKVIALWQGHKDGGKLILDTYSHVRPVHSEKMAQLMV